MRERAADWPRAPAAFLRAGCCRAADMEELSAVGEQVFDAECILSKRLRKVGAPARLGSARLGSVRSGGPGPAAL